MNQDLEQFVQSLLEAKGAPADLEPAVVEQMKQDLYKRVEDRIMAGILSRMSAEQLAEYEKLIDANESAETVQAFTASAIPNLEAVIAAELVDFRTTYLG